MNIILVVALGVTAVVAGPVDTSERIVGGSVTNIQTYPFAVAILSGFGVTFLQMCGGTIINNRSVLSAAHCFGVIPPGRFRGRVGSTNHNSGGVVHQFSRILNHPNYRRATLDNDFSVLRITNTFAFNNNVRAGRIAGANYNLGDNQVVWAIGWGHTSYRGQGSVQLRHVQIWTINQGICRQRYAARNRAITDNMLCSGWLDVGGRDQCQGDSGGPLLHNGVTVGVCSFGHECARARYPGVNARVSRASNWITSNA